MKSSAILILILAVLCMNTGCKKEKEVVVPQKNAPKADAGSDINLEIPNNWTTLQGKAADTDGTIQNLKWTKISGPRAHYLESLSTYNPKVGWMEEGEYEFELEVTDNDGLIGKDTVKVTVLSNLQKLVIKREDLAKQSNDLLGASIPAEVYSNLKWVFCDYEEIYEQADDGPQPGIDYWLGGGSYFERLGGNIITYFGYDNIRRMTIYY